MPQCVLVLTFTPNTYTSGDVLAGSGADKVEPAALPKKPAWERKLSFRDQLALTGKGNALPLSKAVAHAVSTVTAVMVIMVTLCFAVGLTCAGMWLTARAARRETRLK